MQFWCVTTDSHTNTHTHQHELALTRMALRTNKVRAHVPKHAALVKVYPASQDVQISSPCFRHSMPCAGVPWLHTHCFAVVVVAAVIVVVAAVVVVVVVLVVVVGLVVVTVVTTGQRQPAGQEDRHCA